MEVATAENGWVNTIASSHPEAIAKARHILQRIHYCSLSTCSPDGFPWVSPVFFTYDQQLNFYWSSAIASRHSQNLYTNGGRVAIAVYNSDVEEGKGQGIYFYGTAAELEPTRVEAVMQLLFKRSGRVLPRTAEDYLNDSPRRIYHFQPTEAWVTGDRIPIGNQLVDTKIQLDLATFAAPS
jgi:uncharacterized protein YhbP (UPF0306 family)